METQKLIEFINSKASKCSFCGSEDLQLVMGDMNIPDEYALMIWGKFDKAMPLYAVGCRNCGHMHLFSKKQINALLKSEDDKEQ